MARLRKAGVFLLILVLIVAGLGLAAWDTVTDCVSVLTKGVGDGQYSLLGSDAAGDLYVLGQRDGAYMVVRGTETGKRREVIEISRDVLPKDTVPAAFYPAPDGSFYLGLYDLGEPPVTLKLYRLSADGKSAEMVLSEPGNGESISEQTDSVRLSEFTGTTDRVSFAVLTGNEAHFYHRGRESGLLDDGTVSEPGLRNAKDLNSEVWVLVADAGLVRTDREALPLTEGGIITQLDEAGIGVYYVDGAGLNVYYADFANWQPYSYISLENNRYDMDDCTDLLVTRSGGVAVLLDGNRLVMDRGSAVTDLTAMLHRSTLQSVLILAGMLLGSLALTAVIWYVVCVQRRSRLPLLLRRGLMLAAVAVLSVTALIRVAIPAFARLSAEREALDMMSAAVELKRGECGTDDLPALAARGLSAAGNGLFRDARGALASFDGAEWRLENGGGLPKGVRAELYRSFDAEMAEEAAENGYSFRTVGTGMDCRFLYAYHVDGKILMLDVSGEGLVTKCRDDAGWMIGALAGLGALLTVLALLALVTVTGGLRKLMNGMEKLIQGERDVEVRIDSGDELTSLGEDLTALTKAMSDREEEHRRLEASYRRFVPERVLSLLGKHSIYEVDKRTFITRNLATMRFSFYFPEETYEKSGRGLFDNVNETIERTASIVTGRGGAVFNFAYDGYDAVFEEGSSAAVSAAVAIQQEILEINREREAEERPHVSARITIDEGTVMLGVVGDENQIEPTSISTSFTEARRLMELCVRLDATILCTETVAARAEGYSSRYIGKCSAGGLPIRTYEIFDGDPYESRKFKEQTLETFADGIYAFYAGDYQKAKSVFLSLVRRSAGDGCARFYLYLADRMEKEENAQPSLDAGL